VPATAENFRRVLRKGTVGLVPGATWIGAENTWQMDVVAGRVALQECPGFGVALLSRPCNMSGCLEVAWLPRSGHQCFR
jgi:hypothetical protein